MPANSRNSLALAIILAASLSTVLNLLGIMPLVREKAALLHFPGIVLGIFLIGAGLALWTRGDQKNN